MAEVRICQANVDRIGIRARRSALRHSQSRLTGLLLGVALVAGCTASPSVPSAESPARSDSGVSSAATPATSAPEPPRPVTRRTVWLCRPGLPDSPCEGGLDATEVGADGARVERPFVPATDPAADCFYVYPTVSEAASDNAPARATDAEVYAVRAQAARFGQGCRVFAPVYRQITRTGLASGALARPAARDLAYGDVLSAFNDYLNDDNKGRPFVLVGHSQGASNLVRLIQEQIDGDPLLRSKLLSAILLGFPVTVLPGELVGGTFQNIPACTSAEESGCVVSYATYAGEPPANGIFGRSTADRQALCVSPAALLSRGRDLTPYLPTAALTGIRPGVADPPDPGFVTFGEGVSGRCRTTASFSWLDVQFDPEISALRPSFGARTGPAWGLHTGDVSLALGDLVDLVAEQSAAWVARGSSRSSPRRP